MKSALPKLEKGLFVQSLEEVDKALTLLVETSDPSKYQNEIKYCIAYKLALGLLIDVKKLEKESSSNDLLAKIGIRTKYLADLPLEPKHRVVCMRMAINKNIDAGNYGIASRLLEVYIISNFIVTRNKILIPKNLPDKSKLEEKLKICKQHYSADGNTPAFICPSCSTEVAAGIVACSCGRKIKFCFKSFDLLSEPVYYSCSFCSSAFSTKIVSTSTQDINCELCKYGKLVKIE
jgi:DNA-directed RNA polymerase subunit RPC12/RpoP